jgi:molybdenum cofactor biosynthesis enzyme MoaA
MNIYKILKLSKRIHNPYINLAGIFAFHVLRRRYLGVFLDPALACNLRCQMCHFSDDGYRKALTRKILNMEQIEKISNGFFHRALKLQIGCAAEPTVYKDLASIIKLGKQKQIPYISLTTNANLLNPELLEDYLHAGLDEITISLHGVYKQTYEKLMANANYEKFHSALKIISEAKKTHNLKLRINYTMNADNIDELKDFFQVFGHIDIDSLQMRPIVKQGNTAYANFDHTEIINKYDVILAKIREEALKRNITCIAPLKNQLIEQENSSLNENITQSTYCYISPDYAWRKDYDLENDTFESYSKRTRAAFLLFKNIFKRNRVHSKNKRHFKYDIN